MKGETNARDRSHGWVRTGGRQEAGARCDTRWDFGANTVRSSRVSDIRVLGNVCRLSVLSVLWLRRDARSRQFRPLTSRLLG